LVFKTAAGGANDERARIDSSGRLLVGTSTATNNLRFEEKLAIVGNVAGGNGYPGAAFTYYGTTALTSGLLEFNRSRGTADGTYTEVVSGDWLGAINFRGADGVGWSDGALIVAEADGDWTTSGDTTDSPGRLVFYTTADGASSPTERMRIDSNGYIYFGSTISTVVNSSTSSVYGSAGQWVFNGKNGNDVLRVNQTFDDTATRGAIRFYRNETEVGSITVSTTATAYNTSSDYRLKENVVDLDGAIDRIKQLPVHRFNFIADPDKTVDGFIAHEAQAVVPECVTGTKDEVDEDGNPIYQGIDQSKLVPLLTAALQETIAELQALKAEVAALKAS
jgi:hypothetical protein